MADISGWTLVSMMMLLLMGRRVILLMWALKVYLHTSR